MRNSLTGIFFPFLLTLMFFFNDKSSNYKDYIIIIIFLGYLIFLYFKEKRYLMKYSYIIFYITTNILGVFIIEIGSFYLTELDIYSFKVNSLLLLVLVHVIFMETIRLLNRDNPIKDITFIDSSYILIGKRKINKLRVIELLLVIIFIMYLVLFLNVANKPFFLVQLDRFLYQEQYLSNLEEKIGNSFLYLSPLISIYLYKTKSKKVYLLLGIVSLYFFWIGHKFSFFLNMCYIVFLPYLWYGSYKILNNILRKSMLLIVVLIIIISFQSSIVYKRDFNENAEYLKMRLAQQGQLWWATYSVTKEGDNNIDKLDDELRTFYKFSNSKEEIYNSGIYKIMKLTTPYDIFLRKVDDKNSRYAYSTQASIYYYFKASGLIIFSLFTAFFFYLITKKLTESIVNINIVEAILYARLWLIFGRVLMQSDFNKLFSVEVLFILLILMILKLIKRNYVTNKKIIKQTQLPLIRQSSNNLKYKIAEKHL
ncbi:DUF6418 domain-containing protein [Siminovitchia sp. FSL W7-1587]|uniref:DUF6418 domain-containing protein n=1 Tax=Siminovitchia sp. FSL W7-1587 TaxID=2954699 RepID=UPI0030D1FC05